MDLEVKKSSHRQITESESKHVVERNGEGETAKEVVSRSRSRLLEDGNVGVQSSKVVHQLEDGNEGVESSKEVHKSRSRIVEDGNVGEESSKAVHQEGSKVLEIEVVHSKSKIERLEKDKSVHEVSTDNASASSKIVAVMEPSASAICSEALEMENEETENMEMALNEEHSMLKRDSDSQEMDVAFSLLIKDDEEVVEEECFEEEEATPVKLDREPYYATFQKSMKDYGTIKRLNQYLQHKLSLYFIKREMTHILKEGEHFAENNIKYKMKLDQFHDLIKRDREERLRVTKENEELKELRDRLKMESDENYASLQQRERETGIGLIFTKTGKEMSEKMLRQCLSNQHDKAMELQQLRLQHVKIKNASADLQTTLRSMDRIGKYTLAEFEQLKMENRTHLDKIEERDEELTRLRKTCNKANQSLAHIREKCSAIEIQIRTLSNRLTECEDMRILAREEVNVEKQRRDYYRNETQRLKLNSGLLTKDKLLLDMEHTIEDINRLELEMKQKNALYAKLEDKVKHMKSAYERESKKPKYKRQLSGLPKKRGIVRQVLR